MKIAVFGASVSAQTIHHTTGDVTGYAEVWRRDHLDQLGADELHQVVYPGNRLSDGGILQLAALLEYGPDVCLFEPLIEDEKRGLPVTDAEIAYAYRTMLRGGIIPVTIMLPRPEDGVPDSFSSHDQFTRFCTQYDLPVIRVHTPDVTDIESKFNGIHTRPEGAVIYAERIAKAFAALDLEELASQLRWLRIPDPGLHVTRLPMPNNAADLIHRIALKITPRPKLRRPDLPRPDLSADPNVITDTNTDTANERAQDPMDTPARVRFRVVQQQDVGPFSPVLDITTTPGLDGAESDASQISIWDEYCHYSRKSFVMMHDARCEMGQSIVVNMARSLSHPDYATCRGEQLDWPLPRDRGLRPKGPVVVISDHPVDIEFAGLQPRHERQPPSGATLPPPPAAAPRLRDSLSLVVQSLGQRLRPTRPARSPGERARELVARGREILKTNTDTTARAEARACFKAAVQLDATVVTLDWGVLPHLEAETRGIYRDRMAARLQSWYRPPHSRVHAHVAALSDKLEMRSYISALGLPLPNILAQADSLEALDWNALPTNRVVIKPQNAGSRAGVVVAVDGVDQTTGASIYPDLQAYIRALYATSFDQPPPVMVEAYLTDVEAEQDPSIIIPRDFKIYCVAGHAGLVRVHDRNAADGQRWMATYDRLGQPLPPPLTGWPEAPQAPPPAGFEAMIDMAETLSHHLPYLIRFDFYLTPDGPVFGEFTTFPNAGMDSTPFGRRTFLQMWELWPD